MDNHSASVLACWYCVVVKSGDANGIPDRDQSELVWPIEVTKKPKQSNHRPDAVPIVKPGLRLKSEIIDTMKRI